MEVKLRGNLNGSVTSVNIIIIICFELEKQRIALTIKKQNAGVTNRSYLMHVKNQKIES